MLNFNPSQFHETTRSSFFHLGDRNLWNLEIGRPNALRLKSNIPSQLHFFRSLFSDMEFCYGKVLKFLKKPFPGSASGVVFKKIPSLIMGAVIRQELLPSIRSPDFVA
jgi:hypothetical protein